MSNLCILQVKALDHRLIISMRIMVQPVLLVAFIYFLHFKKYFHFPLTKNRKIEKNLAVFFSASYLYIGFKRCQPSIENNIHINLDLHLTICSVGKKYL